ncbi:helix-turn-helix domain-containing protein [Chloroflexota bacterium]
MVLRIITTCVGNDLQSRIESGNPEYATVGFVARYCGVSNTTVLRWIKKSQLNAFRLPSGHYRIGKGEFAEFLENCNIPVPDGVYTNISISRYGDEG